MQTLYLLIAKNADFSYTSLLRSIMGEDGEIYFESEIGDDECYSIDGLEKEKLVEILDEEEIDRNCYTINTEKPVEQPKVKVPATPKTTFANNTNLNVDTSDIDEDNKFVIEVISKDYICNGEGYWGEDDWDDLVAEGNILCYIYDAAERSVPDYSPEWLYEILGKYENIPGGYCSEDMESTFIVSKETYDALSEDPHCNSADDYTDCGYDYGTNTQQNTSKQTNNSNAGKFVVLKFTNKQLTELDDEPYYDVICYVYDAEESFLPDHTPDWLYDILNNSPGKHMESEESKFDVDNVTYNYLINHPNCIEHRDAKNSEALDEYDEEDALDNINFTGWNLHMPIKQGGRKAPKGGKEHLEFLKYDRNCNFYNFLLSDETNDFDGHGKHVDLTTMNKWALKDISDKIDWGAENAEIIQFGTTKSGIDYAAGWVCMDYGLPMVIFLYWDGKHIRAFVPYRGNCVDTVSKCMINEDYDNSAYFKKYFNVDMEDDEDFIYHFGEMLDYDQYNFKDCLEEFEARLEAI